ncbi:hypothetical protein ANN_06814 [Periplaneta americana]|uniref:Myb-like domain-containing protein n=1 Tax=Periplaneta americana TaxID=6978 RepID=A0ABQ8TEN6_PERAM|nr:hypothetical protein ANN_06814 [Periplaneta americana]
MGAGAGSSSSEIAMHWDVNGTKLLIDLYKKYRQCVGTYKIRSAKQMWKVISKELSEVLQRNVTENNCENRWRVLDRDYKKYVDAKIKRVVERDFLSLRMRWMSFMAKKRNIHPEILLSSETVVQTPSGSDAVVEVTSGENETERAVEENVGESRKVERNVKRDSVKRKISVLEQIRQDRSEYQRKRLEQEDREIELLEKKVNFWNSKF